MKIGRILLLFLLVIVLGLGAAGAVVYSQWTRGPLPQTDGTITLDGLTAEVTVIRDEWGIPHIYASNTADLRYAQGYVHAQDRWWQMEFWRHVGRGRIQQVTGRNDAAMGQDIFIRTIGWQRAVERDLANLSPETVAELEAFADGVNAYIESRSPGELALEYNVLGLNGVDIEIQPWTPVDSLLFGKVLGWNLTSRDYGGETRRSDLLAELGADMLAVYDAGFDYENDPTIVWPQELPESGPFDPQPRVARDAGLVGIAPQFAGNVGADGGNLLGQGVGIGSNNWVVSGELTESGMPLLANDPHLSQQMPSIWYEVGLHCEPVGPDCPYRVRGFTSPLMPFVIIGNNAHIAWGVTNAGWDVLDLYRVEINPENDLQYRWNDEWRDMTVYDEEIRFGDGGSLTIQVRETHLGPIVTDNVYDEESGTVNGFVNDDALALRWTGSEPSTVVEAGIALNRAQNWDDFYAALRLWDVPAQNFVYADVEGNIGYMTPGRFPVRAGEHSGQLPVDGTTDAYEWRGYLPFEYLPVVVNPARGYLSTANQPTVPLAYYDYLADELADEFGADANYVFRRSWGVGYRGERLNEMLEAETAHTLESFRAIHGDNKLLFAEAVMPYLAELDMGDETLNAARDWLAAWDSQMHAESGEAALFGQFLYRLGRNLFADQLGDITEPGGSNSEMYATSRLLLDPENVWWDDVNTPDTVEDRDAILMLSFLEAYEANVEALGDDRDLWQWGDLHTTTFVANPLGVSGIDIIEVIVNSGPHPTSGGAAILNANSWSFGNEDNPFAVRAIPSMRMIIDFSDFANNRSIHPPGQSGHPFSDHFDDFVEDWQNIDYHPMLWAREDVEANASATLILQPE